MIDYKRQMNEKELRLILELLQYTKHNFDNYSAYPSYGLKLARMKEVDDLTGKIRQMIKDIK